MELRIYSLEDRIAVAGILVKNGYVVSQAKRPREGARTIDYVLVVEESDKTVSSNK